MHPLDDQTNSMDPPSEQIDARIVAALERAPEVRIPEGFAASVAARVPAAQESLSPHTYAIRYGKAAMVACMVLCAAAMLLLAPRATGHAIFWMSLEWVLCAEFCVLAASLGMWLAGDRVLSVEPAI
jgi:hypothetical protein